MRELHDHHHDHREIIITVIIIIVMVIIIIVVIIIVFRSDDLNLGEVFEAMSKKDHQRLWGGALSVVSPVVEEGRFLLQEQVKRSKDFGASGYSLRLTSM